MPASVPAAVQPLCGRAELLPGRPAALPPRHCLPPALLPPERLFRLAQPPPPALPTAATCPSSTSTPAACGCGAQPALPSASPHAAGPQATHAALLPHAAVRRWVPPRHAGRQLPSVALCLPGGRAPVMVQTPAWTCPPLSMSCSARGVGRGQRQRAARAAPRPAHQRRPARRQRRRGWRRPARCAGHAGGACAGVAGAGQHGVLELAVKRLPAGSESFPDQAPACRARQPVPYTCCLPPSCHCDGACYMQQRQGATMERQQSEKKTVRWMRAGRARGEPRRRASLLHAVCLLAAGLSLIHI